MDNWQQGLHLSQLFLFSDPVTLQEHQANEVRGAHEVIRHTSMRLFWVRAAGPHEELPWAQFWKSFPSTLHGADTNSHMRQTVTVIDNRQVGFNCIQQRVVVTAVQQAVIAEAF